MAKHYEECPTVKKYIESMEEGDYVFCFKDIHDGPDGERYKVFVYDKKSAINFFGTKDIIGPPSFKRGRDGVEIHLTICY